MTPKIHGRGQPTPKKGSQQLFLVKTTSKMNSAPSNQSECKFSAKSDNFKKSLLQPPIFKHFWGQKNHRRGFFGTQFWCLIVYLKLKTNIFAYSIGQLFLNCPAGQLRVSFMWRSSNFYYRLFRFPQITQSKAVCCILSSNTHFELLLFRFFLNHKQFIIGYSKHETCPRLVKQLSSTPKYQSLILGIRLASNRMHYSGKFRKNCPRAVKNQFQIALVSLGQFGN